MSSLDYNPYDDYRGDWEPAYYDDLEPEEVEAAEEENDDEQ